MFKKQKPARLTNRARTPSGGLNESFRRNNIVFSKSQREVAEHQQSVSQRQAERRRQSVHRRTRRKLVAALLAVVVMLFAYFSSVSSVSLESNASSRLGAAQSKEYEEAILNAFNSHTLFRQSWLADRQAAAAAVQKQFPEIERISLSSRPLSPVIQSEIRFRTPVFTWKDASNAPQFVDQHGVLFSKNLDPGKQTADLIAIEDQSGVVLEEGSAVLTQNLIQFVGQLYAKIPQLYGKGASVSRVIIPRSTREVQIQVAGQPYLIKFNTSRDIEEQVGELKALLGFLQANSITPTQYIDLRVAHKAFYK